MIDLEIVQDLTVDDLETLPDGYRYELHEGNLVIMSPATLWHSRIGHRLTAALRAAGRAAYQEVGIKLGKQSSRTADIAIFPSQPDESRAFFEPHEILVFIETVSPSSVDDDRVVKPLLYARAGIGGYWRVEREKDSDEAIVFQHELARTNNGAATYLQTGVTSLSLLEAGR